MAGRVGIGQSLRRDQRGEEAGEEEREFPFPVDTRHQAWMAQVLRRSIAFQGRIEDAWRANLELRTAVRVLMRVVRFTARDANRSPSSVAA